MKKDKGLSLTVPPRQNSLISWACSDLRHPRSGQDLRATDPESSSPAGLPVCPLQPCLHSGTALTQLAQSRVLFIAGPGAFVRSGPVTMPGPGPPRGGLPGKTMQLSNTAE